MLTSPLLSAEPEVPSSAPGLNNAGGSGPTGRSITSSPHQRGRVDFHVGGLLGNVQRSPMKAGRRQATHTFGLISRKQGVAPTGNAARRAWRTPGACTAASRRIWRLARRLLGGASVDDACQQRRSSRPRPVAVTHRGDLSRRSIGFRGRPWSVPRATSLGPNNAFVRLHSRKGCGPTGMSACKVPRARTGGLRNPPSGGAAADLPVMRAVRPEQRAADGLRRRPFLRWAPSAPRAGPLRRSPLVPAVGQVSCCTRRTTPRRASPWSAGQPQKDLRAGPQPE